MVLVLCGVGAILRERYGFRGQNYVALLQGSEIPSGFDYTNLILGISCFRLITLNVY